MSSNKKIFAYCFLTVVSLQYAFINTGWEISGLISTLFTGGAVALFLVWMFLQKYSIKSFTVRITFLLIAVLTYIATGETVFLIMLMTAMIFTSVDYKKAFRYLLNIRVLLLLVVIFAALVNIGLNFILIPIFQQNAAAFTTVIAELLSMIITWWNGRKYFKVSFLKKDIGSVAIGCVAIWIVCSMTEKYISSVLISTAFSVIASVAAYMIILLIMKNQAVKLVLEILHIKK